MPAVRAASQAELGQFAQAATALERAVKGPVSLAIAQRYAFWARLGPSCFGTNAQSCVSPATAAANRAADIDARYFAMAVRGLDTGQLQLAVWLESTEQSGVLHMGIVKAGTLQAGMGQWQAAVLPLVAYAVRGAIAVGTWVVVDAWAKSQQAKSDADKLRAQTAAEVASAVTKLSASSPQKAQQLAATLKQATDAANNVQPGFLDQLSSAASGAMQRIGEAATGVGQEVGAWLPLALLAVYALSRRRTNPRRHKRGWCP